MANTTIVTTEAEAVNTVDALQSTWEAACDTLRVAHAASIARPGSIALVRALQTAMDAETSTHTAWKEGQRALQAMWRAEDAEYDAMLCAQYDAMDNATDYPEHYDASMPLPYTITTQGYTYLDHHYQTDSEAGMLADGGASPYGDGKAGYVQATPIPSYVPTA